MASVVKKIRPGVTQRVNVKNLGWFFRKARKVAIEKFSLWQSNDGWEMFADFTDGDVFETHFNSFVVFKEVMYRQRSLKGVIVDIHPEDGTTTHLVIGRKSSL